MREKTGSRMPRASMKHILALEVKIPVSQEAQEELVAFFESRMEVIEIARGAIQEQLSLIDALVVRILNGFPDAFNSAKKE
jgi:hypothetical protein